MSIEVYSDFEMNGYRHVRLFSFDPCLTLTEFKEFIEKRWPGEKFWRQIPKVEESHDFEKDAAFVWFYARFSIKVENGKNQ